MSIDIGGVAEGGDEGKRPVEWANKGIRVVVATVDG